MLVKVGGRNLEVRKCNPLQKITGLMFCRRENAKILLFEFDKPTRIAIHSFFVFFPFVAIWLDSEDKVVEKRIVYPWNFHIKPKKDFVKLMEVPLNKKYSGIFEKIGFSVENSKHL